MDSVLSVRLREGQTNVVRWKVTSVVARSGYKAYGGYMAEFTDMATGALRILLLTTGVGGGISAIRLCVRLYSGLQHLLLRLSIWRCLTCSGSICACVWWITSVRSTVKYSK